MTYAVKDKSVHDGAPIECYEFVATHKTWRYTSYHEAVQVAGQWYTPLPITRTAIEVGSVVDSQTTMDFNIPSDHEIAQQFCYTISPKGLVVTVRRVHQGDDYSTDYKVEWIGQMSGSSYAGNWATIKTASKIRTALNGYLSSVFYQKTCNHVLYDERCKADREAHTEEATVTKIQRQIITVDDMVYDNSDLIGGTMTNTRTGEQQGIISNDNNVLRIGYPFFDLEVGDVVELTLGCDHQRLGHCKNRFDNVVNYGGFDFVPEINPFEKLVYTSATRTEVTESGTITYRPPADAGFSTRPPPGRRTSYGTSVGVTMPPRPRPTSTSVSNFGSSSEGSGNIPAAFLGQIVCAVLGQKRVPNHNLIWTGNLRPITETIESTTTRTEEVNHGGGYVETVTITETVYTTTTVGYFIDMQLGICLGPDVHLIGIYVNGERIWNGDVGPARTEVTLPDNDTFLKGAKIYFSGGQYDQSPEPLIDTPDYPGYVGIANVFLKDVRADLAMGQISFEVVRIPNPLGLSSAVNKIGNDINVMTAIAEVITNEWGYGGLDISNVDVTQFTDMAEVLIDEDNICSVKIDSEVGIAEVIAALQNQAQAVIFENPETALITGRLIRTDVLNYATMPRFHDGNIIDLRSFEKTGWPDTIEQARGVYTERDAEYNEVPVFVQNAANISQSGRGKRTVTFQYPFVPNKTLALNLLSRDVAELSAPAYSFEIVTNRDGATMLPGEIITVTWPDANLLNIPMQVRTVRKQDINNNNVVLRLQQARYPSTRPLFGLGGDPYDPGFDVGAKTPTGARIISAPYYMARARNGITSQQVNPLNYPMFLPEPANSFQTSFSTYINNLPGTSNPVLVSENAAYGAFARLVGIIDTYDGFDDGIIDEITIDGIINPGVLSDIGEQGVRDGRMFMFIGNEILSFESATNEGSGVWKLHDVHRALLDTVFETHSDDTAVYIVGNNFSNVSRSGFTYPVGYTPSWSFVSNGVTETGTMLDALVTTSWSPGSMRTLSPPRPHNTKVNGSRGSTPVAITEGGSVTVTWATRSRTAIKVALMLDDAENPEVNSGEQQKHRVFHRTPGGTITEIGDEAYTGNTATFTMPDVANGLGTIFVRSEIILGGVVYTSIAQDRVPVNVS